MVLPSELAIIALAEMGKEIAITIRVIVQNPDTVMRDRFLKETEPLHNLAVLINTAWAKLLSGLIEEEVKPKP